MAMTGGCELPSPIEGEGEGAGFYIDEQDGQDFELDGNGIARQAHHERLR